MTRCHISIHSPHIMRSILYYTVSPYSRTYSSLYILYIHMINLPYSGNIVIHRQCDWWYICTGVYILYQHHQSHQVKKRRDWRKQVMSWNWGCKTWSEVSGAVLTVMRMSYLESNMFGLHVHTMTITHTHSGLQVHLMFRWVRSPRGVVSVFSVPTD